MNLADVEGRGSAAATGSGLFARAIERRLPALDAGRLVVVLPDGERIVRQGAQAGPDAQMSIHRRRALRRILLNGEAGFADGFLDGDWSTPDLPALLDLLLANEGALKPRRRAARTAVLGHRLLHTVRANTRAGSRRNIAAHYDLGNAFYGHWLDGGMNYSSALFSTAGQSLEAAQEAKLERVAELLELEGGDRVLEIGCGWGALAERLLQRVASYTGITLSVEQRDHARARLEAIGAREPDIRLQDYREVEQRYDRIASIEMLEAVGERYWPVYFDRIRAALAPGGVAVLQVITIAADRFGAYRRRPDFIQRNIFPGGMLPTAERVVAEVRRAGLTLSPPRAFGASYALTLAEWRRRFLKAWPAIAPLGFDERFRRMWEYYLAYCEAGFRHGSIDVRLFQLKG